MQAQAIPLANLPIGTVLGRQKGLLQHQGIYMGNGYVFENTWESGERLSTFAEFAEQKTVTALNVIKLSASDIYKRVKDSLQKKRPYCPITNNCEQSVNRIALGFAWSWQVVFWAAAVILAVAWLVVGLRRK